MYAERLEPIDEQPQAFIDPNRPGNEAGRWGWIASAGFVAAILLTLLLAAIPSPLPPARAAGQTDVSGAITGVVTWTRANSPYVVQDPGVTVETGGVLIIEPGVEVRFEVDTTLDVYGELTAVGAMTRPITFTSNAASPRPGDWWGITFDYEGAGQLAWCDLSYAGDIMMMTEGALTVYSPDVAVSHCRIHDNGGNGASASTSGALQLSNVTIEDNDGHGVEIADGALNPTLEDVTIANNQGAAVQQAANVMIPTYRSITATGNLTDAIVIQGGELSRGAYWDFAQAGIPVQIAGYVYLPSEHDLTVQPGTALYFWPGGSLDIWWGGNLYALGISEAPITFTGVISQPGSWEGIDGGEGGRILLDHCDLSFGGANDMPLLDVRDDSIIQNSRIHHSAGTGIKASGQPTITYNQIYSNTDYGLYSSNMGADVDARLNWWGHSSGPYHPDQNPAGQGDKVSDNVQFSPWLTDTTAGDDLQEARLAVSLAGPDYVHPGEVVEYAVIYNNLSTRTITSPLVLMLPTYAQYVGHTGDGAYWPKNHEVFWDDDLAPSESMVESVRVRYLWGLEKGTHLALSYPAAITTTILNAHLGYTPTGAITEVALSQTAFEAQCATQQELDQLYGQFLDEGRVFASASRQTFRGGDVITQATLLASDRNAVIFLQYDGKSISSIRMDPTK
ncbi:MAG: right-handed parallel beta-helix repeat-containing protein, partial [Chloroflexota bacterium]|nr:right-handed parallel beta-helix repeat-containing protein [Chloroflexota bacterium]